VNSSLRALRALRETFSFHAELAKPAEKRAQDETMIVEVRSYRITPGKRDEFIEFFETRSIEALRSHGMKVVGPMVDVENPNKFVFLRGFPTMEDLHRMKDEFYGGKLWKKDVLVRNGLKQEDAKKIVKHIKDAGLKAQASIMDDIIRVTSKKIDDLQTVIQASKEWGLGIPLQYENMRS